MTHRAWLDSYGNSWDVEDDDTLSLRDSLCPQDICRPFDEVNRLHGQLRPAPPFPVLPAYAYDTLGLVRDSHPQSARNNPHRKESA